MITLYIYHGCPYCDKVRHYFDVKKLKIGKDFVLVDAKTPAVSKELLKIGGKQQVPFLVDGNTFLYESEAIIDYIKHKYS